MFKEWKASISLVLSMLVFNREYFCGSILWKYSKSPHYVLGGKWHLQVLGKHLQYSSSVVKPYFHIKLFHSRSFKVRCFFKQSLIRSLLVSHQGGNIFFLFAGEHLLPEYRVAIHLKWEFSFFAMCCLQRSALLPGTTPALKLLWKGLGFLTNTFCRGYGQHSLEGLQRGA